MRGRWAWLLTLGATATVVLAAAWYWRAYGGNDLTVAATVVAAIVALMAPIWAWALKHSRRSRQTGAVQPGTAARRQMFARNVEDHLRFLSSAGEWSDEQYAELEAESLAGAASSVRMLRWHRSGQSNAIPRRERSLTQALLHGRDQLTVLEGEPGSGKSVALRHLALQLAKRAQQSAAGADSLIALYVDLKYFRPRRHPVDSEAVREFIYDTLNRLNDRDVGRYLADEFDPGLAAGKWLLLFDSFDEIPDLLGVTESDSAVSLYAQAIITFVRNRNCRAVIASREFRGPPTFRLPRLNVVRLADHQQRILIKSSGLQAPLVDAMISDIAQAEPELRQLAGNPQFLRLLCEYWRCNGEFPANAHGVFHFYVGNRLAKDADRIQRRFGLSSALLRLYAEELAFCMAASPDLALSPTRDQLEGAIALQGRVAPRRVADVLDALAYAKLGQAESSPNEPGVTRFAFIHRRFQDYFATCAVLREQDRVTPETMLTDGHWRETVVAILQTQPGQSNVLLQTAREKLLAMTGRESDSAREPFNWPPGLLHLLGVIAAAYGRTPSSIPPDIRALAGNALTRAWRVGRRHDRIWVIDMVLAAPDTVTADLLADAFESPSQILREGAYRQAAWLKELPRSVEIGIQRALFSMWASGKPAKQGPLITAQLRRFGHAGKYLAAYRLLRSIMTVDLILLSLVACPLLLMSRGWLIWAVILAFAAAHLALHLRRAGLAATVQLPQRSVHLVDWNVPLQPISLGLRVAGRLLRIAIAGLAIWYLAQRLGMRLPLSLLGYAAVVYALAWADSAMDQVLAGRLIRGRIWPLLPFYWLRPGTRVLDKRLTRAFFWICAYGGSMGIVFFAAWAASGFQSNWDTGPGRPLPWFVNIFMWLVLAAAILVLIVSVGGEALDRHWALRDAHNRVQPYTVSTIEPVLLAMQTPRDIKELVRILKFSPQLCPPDVLHFLSDVANAADRGNHRRHFSYKFSNFPSHVTVPPDSSPAFVAWVAAHRDRVADFLLMMDVAAVDEITQFVADTRKAVKLFTKIYPFENSSNRSLLITEVEVQAAPVALPRLCS
jgi:hypothetical protein